MRTLLIALLLFASAPAFSQECDGLLKPDLTAIATSAALRLSFLMQIDEKKYDESKKRVDWAGTIPVGDVLFGQTTSFEDFRKHRASESQKLDFRYNREESTWYYATRIPNERSRDFLECVTSNKSGLKISVQNADDNSVILLLKWLPPPENPVPITLDFAQSQNIKNLAELPRTMAVNAERSVTIERKDSDKPMKFVANTGKRSAIYIYPAPPKMIEAPKKTGLALRLAAGKPCVVRLSVPVGDLPANEDYILRYRILDNNFQLFAHNVSMGRWVHGERQNAVLMNNQATLWGAIVNFQEDGTINFNGNNVGRMDCATLD